MPLAELKIQGFVPIAPSCENYLSCVLVKNYKFSSRIPFVSFALELFINRKEPTVRWYHLKKPDDENQISPNIPPQKKQAARVSASISSLLMEHFKALQRGFSFCLCSVCPVTQGLQVRDSREVITYTDEAGDAGAQFCKQAFSDGGESEEWL